MQNNCKRKFTRNWFTFLDLSSAKPIATSDSSAELIFFKFVERIFLWVFYIIFFIVLHGPGCRLHLRTFAKQPDGCGLAGSMGVQLRRSFLESGQRITMMWIHLRNWTALRELHIQNYPSPQTCLFQPFSTHPPPLPLGPNVYTLLHRLIIVMWWLRACTLDWSKLLKFLPALCVALSQSDEYKTFTFLRMICTLPSHIHMYAVPIWSTDRAYDLD